MNDIYCKLRNDRIYEITEKIDVFFLFVLIGTVFINFIFIHTNIFYIDKIDMLLKSLGSLYIYFIYIDIGDIILLFLFFAFRRKIYSFFYKFYGKKRVPYSIKKKLSKMSINYKDIKID